MIIFTRIYSFFIAPRDDEEGATMVEYALLVGLIAITLIVAITALAGGVGDLFNRASDELNAIP